MDLIVSTRNDLPQFLRPACPSLVLDICLEAESLSQIAYIPPPLYPSPVEAHFITWYKTKWITVAAQSQCNFLQNAMVNP